jgi:hypothetical protein
LKSRNLHLNFTTLVQVFKCLQFCCLRKDTVNSILNYPLNTLKRKRDDIVRNKAEHVLREKELQWRFFYILQIKCAVSPTWTSNCTVLPLGSSKLCLTSGGDELVIHHIRQLIMQLFQSQENKRRLWRLWHHWLDWFINLYVALTDSARFKNHNNVFCIRFFPLK